MTEFSYLEIYIDNPILVGILGKYQDFFKDRGFSFEQSTESGNTVLTYSDDEAPYIAVPTSLKTAARDFVMYNRFDFFEDRDEMCDDLLNVIKLKQREINNSYQRLKISYACSNDDDCDLIHCKVLSYEGGQESYQEYDDAL